MGKRPGVRATGAGLALLLLTSTPFSAAEQKKVRPLTREAVAQVWVGVSEDELYFVRLALGTDGTGLGGYVFAEEHPRLFRIASWDYRPERIEMTAVAVGQGGSEIERLT